MDLLLNHQPQHVVVDQALSLRLRRPGWVHVTRGKAWLTRAVAREDSSAQMGSERDLVLAPGAWVWLDAKAHWVIEPLGCADDVVTLQWCALPPRAVFRWWVRWADDMGLSPRRHPSPHPQLSQG